MFLRTVTELFDISRFMTLDLFTKKSWPFCLLHHSIGVEVPFQVLSEVFNLLHSGPINVDGGVRSLLSPVVHDQLLCFVDVEGEVIFLIPLCQRYGCASQNRWHHEKGK